MLPANGFLSFSDFNNELGRPLGATLSMSDVEFGSMCKAVGGQPISMANARGNTHLDIVYPTIVNIDGGAGYIFFYDPNLNIAGSQAQMMFTRSGGSGGYIWSYEWVYQYGLTVTNIGDGNFVFSGDSGNSFNTIRIRVTDSWGAWRELPLNIQISAYIGSDSGSGGV